MKDIIFSNTLSSAREGKLLNEDKLTHILEASDVATAYKLVAEAGFGMGASTIDEAIYLENSDLRTFILENSASEDISYYMLLHYDYLNLEAIVKCKYLGASYQNYTGIDGLYTVSTLVETVQGEDYSTLPKYMGACIRYCDDVFAQDNAKGYLINAYFTRNKYKHLLAVIKNPTIIDLIKHTIDFVNISTAIRSKSVELAHLMYVEGGLLPYDILDGMVDGISDNVLNSVYEYGYKPYLEQVSNDNLWMLELLRDKYTLATLTNSRFEQNGAMPFFTYCVEKQYEIKNINIILKGINANMSKTDIKGRLILC